MLNPTACQFLPRYTRARPLGRAGGVNIIKLSYQYMNSPCGDKTILTSYLPIMVRYLSIEICHLIVQFYTWPGLGRISVVLDTLYRAVLVEISQLCNVLVGTEKVHEIWHESSSKDHLNIRQLLSFLIKFRLIRFQQMQWLAVKNAAVFLRYLQFLSVCMYEYNE